MNKQDIICSFIFEKPNEFDCQNCGYVQGVNVVRITQRKYKGVPYVEKDGRRFYSCPHRREAI